MTIDRLLLVVSTILLVVSTGAAAFAAYYARGAVTDARAFHQDQERDTERARLLTIAGTLADLAAVAYTVGVGGGKEFGLLRGRHATFKAAVETTAEPIRLCRILAAVTLGDDSGLYDAASYVHSQTAAAADELHATIQNLA